MLSVLLNSQGPQLQEVLALKTDFPLEIALQNHVVWQLLAFFAFLFENRYTTILLSTTVNFGKTQNVNVIPQNRLLSKAQRQTGQVLPHPHLMVMRRAHVSSTVPGYNSTGPRLLGE